MCESTFYTDGNELVMTLYGVVHEAMLTGKTYFEVVSAAQEWVSQHKRHYMRTGVEEREGRLYVVVYTCADFSEMFRKDCVMATDVPVPESFLNTARGRLVQQQS